MAQQTTIRATSRYRAIRLPPGMGPAVLGVPAHEIRDARPLLAELWPPDTVRRWADQLFAASAGEQYLLLERLVAERTGTEPGAGGDVGDCHGHHRCRGRGRHRGVHRVERTAAAPALSRCLRLRTADVAPDPALRSGRSRGPLRHAAGGRRRRDRLRRPGTPGQGSKNLRRGTALEDHRSGRARSARSRLSPVRRQKIHGVPVRVVHHGVPLSPERVPWRQMTVIPGSPPGTCRPRPAAFRPEMPATRRRESG